MLRSAIRKITPPCMKTLIKNNLLLFRAKQKMKPFLSPGIYRIRMHPGSKIKITFVTPPYLIKIGKPCKGSVSETNISGIKPLSLYLAYKIVFLTDEKVISFYMNTDNGRDRLSRIEKYLSYILYPSSEFLEISTRECYSIVKRVPGDSFLDLKHALYYAHELLQFAVRSEEMKRPERFRYLDGEPFKNIRYHVQHGDMQPFNVLWQDDTHYTVIDFDEIDVFPTFYDFFYVILSDKERGITEYLNGCFDHEIAEYMAAFNINVPVEIFKDECLAAFILIPGKYVQDAMIVSNLVPEHYKKTRDALAIVEK